MNLRDPSAAEHLLALLDCLEIEYQALLAEDLDRLQPALARKAQLLEQLAPLLSRSGGKAAAPLAPAWVRALRRAHDLTRRNAIVLAPRLRANHARLSFLQSCLGDPGLYGANGMTLAARFASAPGCSA
jgi:flagellar biosynthesis/type III secretory pathway chaperone